MIGRPDFDENAEKQIEDKRRETVLEIRRNFRYIYYGA